MTALTRRLGGWLAATSALALAPAATAQTPPQRPAAAPATRPGAVGEVVVTGERPAVQTSIDRRSYSVANDLQTLNGSIGDALRNVPSVQVDVQGNVTLRGDANVTIMIDGKPSGQFQGEGRAAALQSLPADRIERVEVITNPSAEFRADGTAGIINLVTKQARGAGRTGSIRANVGSNERANVSLSGGYNAKQLNLTGDLSWRRDTQKVETEDRRTRLETSPPAGGADSLQTQVLGGYIDQINARGGFDYDRDKANRFSGQLRLAHGRGYLRGFEHFERENTTGAIVSLFDRDGRYLQDRDNGEITGTWRRKYAGDGHELVLNASHEETRDDRRRFSVQDNIFPGAPDSADRTQVKTDLIQNEVKADYTRPFDGGRKLKLGYDLALDENDYDNRVSRAAVAGQPLVNDPRFTNRFLYDQLLNQAYATWEQPVGELTALAGLRVERVDIDFDQKTLGVTGTNDYWRVHPSLHLSYKESDTQTFTASYSHRLQRPGPFDLNPFPTFVDPFNLRAGNPQLKPQETHSIEFGWQYRKAPTFYLATFFVRQNEEVFTDLVRDTGNGVFLTTRINAERTRSGGVEFTANGRLTKKLTYSLNANGYYQQLDSGVLGTGGRRDTFGAYGRANLNWQVTPKDFIQVNGFLNGKQLTAQGYIKPTGMLNLGYRRKVDDKLSILVTAQDVLDTFRNHTVIDTPILKARIKRDVDTTLVYVGFVRTFGGGRRPEPGFDFGGGAPPVGP